MSVTPWAGYENSLINCIKGLQHLLDISKEETMSTMQNNTKRDTTMSIKRPSIIQVFAHLCQPRIDDLIKLKLPLISNG